MSVWTPLSCLMWHKYSMPLNCDLMNCSPFLHTATADGLEVNGGNEKEWVKWPIIVDSCQVSAEPLCPGNESGKKLNPGAKYSVLKLLSPTLIRFLSLWDVIMWIFMPQWVCNSYLRYFMFFDDGIKFCEVPATQQRVQIHCQTILRSGKRKRNAKIRHLHLLQALFC